MIFLPSSRINLTYCIALWVNLFVTQGTVSYLNYFENLEEIKIIAERHCIGQNLSNMPVLVLSFRYAQIIDSEAL